MDKFPSLRELWLEILRDISLATQSRKKLQYLFRLWAQSGVHEANRQNVLFPLARNTVSLEI